LVITRSGEHEAAPILIFHRGEVMKVHVWASNSGRVKVSFLAAKGEWKVFREELLNGRDSQYAQLQSEEQ
jgi:CRP-like cAMP-binding protein